MASRELLLLHMLLALAIVAGAGGATPTMIHYINSANSHETVECYINIGGVSMITPFEVKPGHQHWMRVYEPPKIYSVDCVFGAHQFTGFHAYEPARDKARTVVYWKASDQGFSISYDKTHWKLNATWRFE